MKVYTATQARATFLDLLQAIATCEQVVIAKLDDHTLFKVERVQEHKSDRQTSVGNRAQQGATRP